MKSATAKKPKFELRRIFGRVTRGMTDKTLVCVFPWESQILAEIHGTNFEEISIDDLSSLKDAVKITNTKLKHSTEKPLDLREQLDAMATNFEVNPLEYPQMEYHRLTELYGMHADVALPNVEKVYGSERQFRDMLLRFVQLGGAMPGDEADGTESVLDDDGETAIADLSVKELKAKLTALNIDFKGNASRADLEDLLVTATA